MLKNKFDVNYKGSFENQYQNAILVAREFLAAVKAYGVMGCVNRRALLDKRFKITRNGSYYELCGYCFTYDFMHDTDEIHWTFVDFDCDTVVRGMPMKLGEAYAMFAIREGVSSLF